MSRGTKHFTSSRANGIVHVDNARIETLGRDISVLILTYDEAPNIRRSLDALRDFPEVVLLDSGSTDETQDIAAQYPNVRVVVRKFDSHSAQWNFGINECELKGEWVLALDADYLVPPALVNEIMTLAPPARIAGYRARFRYCVWGRPLSGSLYPPVVVLYKRRCAHYVQDGHTQRVVVDGEVANLREAIRHDDQKPLARWLQSQSRYAELECNLLLSKSWRELRWRDRLRRLIVVTPWLVPVYCLTIGRGFLDGRAGLYYALQRCIAETVLSLQLIQTQRQNYETKQASSGKLK